VIASAQAFGVSPSAISQRIVEVTSKRLEEFKNRPLKEFKPFAVFQESESLRFHTGIHSTPSMLSYRHIMCNKIDLLQVFKESSQKKYQPGFALDPTH
jgi:hypothetical protein